MRTPWLVADIGGTNARFGLVDGPGGKPENVETLAVAEHKSLADAVAAYLEEHGGGVWPEAACLAIAGPVKNDRYRLTNAAWSGTASDLNLPHVDILNDFEALAISLPHLAGDDLAPLGGPPPSSGHVKAVLGPGTGLGVAGLAPTHYGWAPVPGEGGHVSAPVVTDLEFEVVRALRTDGLAHVEAEHLLSGPGLHRLHHGLSLVHGVPSEDLQAKDIVASDDPLAVETIEVFLGLLGGFAGNVALTLGARGGVYLGGGILPRIVDRIPGSSFRARFELTGPALSDYVAAIATVLIVSEMPALIGDAAWLAQRLRPTEGVHEPA
ncbi:glucokinase [Streptosporangiaceae bacterium NEAU-GS5]|nr:glucokinase [Streptosporangiaceae bacterium NEAU-GS5]